ncbi:MAG: nucleotidyltransferase substrate binding protein [Desulfurivibrionaceae bacterium]
MVAPLTPHYKESEVKDIRWKQRFDNYTNALQTLSRAVELSRQRDLSELEQQGMIQGFEFTHELAWNVLKDYLEEQGFVGIVGSRNATREAFRNGLLNDGETWMDMIKARNLALHTYAPHIAEDVAKNILTRFHPAFVAMAQRFGALAGQPETSP